MTIEDLEAKRWALMMDLEEINSGLESEIVDQTLDLQFHFEKILEKIFEQSTEKLHEKIERAVDEMKAKLELLQDEWDNYKKSEATKCQDKP